MQTISVIASLMIGITDVIISFSLKTYVFVDLNSLNIRIDTIINEVLFYFLIIELYAFNCDGIWEKFGISSESLTLLSI